MTNCLRCLGSHTSATSCCPGRGLLDPGPKSLTATEVEYVNRMAADLARVKQERDEAVARLRALTEPFMCRGKEDGRAIAIARLEAASSFLASLDKGGREPSEVGSTDPVPSKPAVRLEDGGS